MCVCVCGWQKSWHSGIWKRWLSLQTNSWSGGLIGRRISTPLCLRLIAIWLRIKLCKLEVNRYLVTGVEIADNLFLIFTQDSRTSYLKTVWENHIFFFSLITWPKTTKGYSIVPKLSMGVCHAEMVWLKTQLSWIVAFGAWLSLYIYRVGEIGLTFTSCNINDAYAWCMYK